MKILLIARTCPYPPNDGEKIRVFNIIKSMKKHDVTLVCRTMSDADLRGLEELKKYCKNIYSSHIPSPASFWQRMKWLLPFVFSKYPISISTVYFPEIVSCINEACKDEKFDVVQVEHSSLSVYLDKVNFDKYSKFVLTMHNIDYIRNERVIENLTFGIEKLYQIINQLKFKTWELSSLSRYDHIIAMSDVDKLQMLKDNSSLSISVVPNGVDSLELSNDDYIYHDDSNYNVIFVASMDSDANHDGAIYFIDEIYPLIKAKIPQLKFYAVGRGPKKSLLERANGEDIFVTGLVDSVIDYYKDAKVAIVPLRSGGGTRLKIFEAMSMRVPVVSTTVGAEGIEVENSKNIMLCDDKEVFADAVICLLSDSAFHKDISFNARKLIEKQYDWDVISKAQDIVYDGLVSNHME